MTVGTTSKPKRRKRADSTETLKIKQAIIDLIKTDRYQFKIEIHKQLVKMGFNLDLKRLNNIVRSMPIQKYADPETGVRYLHYEDRTPQNTIQNNLRTLIISMNHNNSIVVIKTIVGAAPLVAKNIDQNLKQLPDILGTIAGDDTIFIVPRDYYNCEEVIRGIERAMNANLKEENPTNYFSGTL